MDHVFPRCLFPDPMPDDSAPLMTVPACTRHNGAFSRDEEYFRDFVLGQSYNDSDAKALWDGKTRRALQRSPKYQALLASQVHDLDVRTPAGILLGKLPVMVADRERVHLVFRKIVTGLYLHEYGVTLGFPPMNVHQMREPADLEPVRSLLESMPLRVLGPVTYRYARTIDEPRAVIGAFFFFGHAAFVVMSDPTHPDEADPLGSPRTSQPTSGLWTPPPPRPREVRVSTPGATGSTVDDASDATDEPVEQ
jgi:hypothetical protein